MNTPWQIQLFGGLQLQRERESVQKFRTQKAAALLARLAFYPHRSHPREELIEQLWPDTDAVSGRNNLKQTLSSLRRQLEPPGTPYGSVIAADRTMVRLNPDAFRTDVVAFEAALKAAGRTGDPQAQLSHLGQALELYGGELLPGHYDDWVLLERERLILDQERAQNRLEELRRQQPSTLAPPPPSPPPASRPEPRLPIQFTRFFGRREELSQIQALLDSPEVRLVTLTGPGGTGKTRLAVEAARQAAQSRSGPVIFVPLADLDDPRLIVSAVVDGLRLPRGAAADPMADVVAALEKEADSLLILDNLEQFAEEAAPTLLLLLTRVPHLQILATSRQRLFVAGEREFAVAPLAVASGETTPEQIAAIPSVQLFVDRAQLSRADFQVTPRNAGVVADICRQMEGLPLALELAASWTQILSPRQISERLGERFTLLVNRGKDVPERHRTAWAAVAWSYDLLSSELQRFWASLSVFRGGWTAEMAQDVCEEPQALTLLAQLQSRSLVSAEDDGEQMRYRMLETLREFAWTQLAPDEQTQAAERHAGFFLRLSRDVKEGLTGARQAQWYQRLDAEEANIRAALAWSLAHDGTAALELAGNLWHFWAIRGRHRESAAVMEAALAAAPDAPDALKIVAFAGAFTFHNELGNHETAQTFAEQGLRLARGIGHTTGVRMALHNLAMTAYEQDDFEQAMRLNQECYEISQASGDLDGSTRALNNLGLSARELGDYQSARDYFEQSLVLKREIGDRQSIANSLGNLGLLADDTGDYDAAYDYYRQCLQLMVEFGNRTGILLTLVNMAQTAHRRKDSRRLAVLMAAAQTIQELMTAKPLNWADFQTEVEDARTVVGPAAFDEAWAFGQAMTLEEAVEYAMGDAPG